MTHGGEEAASGLKDSMGDASCGRLVGQHHLQAHGGDVLRHDEAGELYDADSLQCGLLWRDCPIAWRAARDR